MVEYSIRLEPTAAASEMSQNDKHPAPTISYYNTFIHTISSTIIAQ